MSSKKNFYDTYLSIQFFDYVINRAPEKKKKKKKRRFLTPKTKTILMGSVIGTLVGCIGLAIGLTLLVQSC